MLAGRTVYLRRPPIFDPVGGVGGSRSMIDMEMINKFKLKELYTVL